MSSLSGVVGPFVIGTTLDSVLLGVVTLQLQAYFSRFPDDNKFFRYSVITLVVLALFHTAMSVRDLYDIAVLHFGDLEYLAKGPVGLLSNVIVTGIMAFVVQAFYAWRIFIMSNRKIIIPVILVALAAVSMIFAIVTSVRTFQIEYLADFDQTTYTVILWLGVAAFVDVLVTVLLVYHLRNAQKSTAYQPTKSLLTKIIANTIENNLLTSLVACIDAVLFGVSSTQWHVAPNLTLGKLYLLSFLVSLNSRGGLSQSVSEDREKSSVENGINPFGGKKSGHAGVYPPLAIKVTLDTAQAEAFGEPEPDRQAKGRRSAPHGDGSSEIQELDEMKMASGDDSV